MKRTYMGFGSTRKGALESCNVTIFALLEFLYEGGQGAKIRFVIRETEKERMLLLEHKFLPSKLQISSK